MKTRSLGLLVFLMAALLAVADRVSAQADPPPLSLSLRRDWGYGGLDGRIQGRFTLRVKEESLFVRVVFYLDETEMAVLDEPPFAFRFHTGDYPPGEHRLWAQAFTAEGETVASEPIYAYFLTDEEGREATTRILIVVGGLSLVSTVLAGLMLVVLGRSEKSAGGSYGLLGGTICPHCGKPYAMHFYAPNLVTHRFDRCPHCGRWALVRRQPLDALRAAEGGAEDNPQAPASQETEEERLRRLLDESRYE